LNYSDRSKMSGVDLPAVAHWPVGRKAAGILFSETDGCAGPSRSAFQEDLRNLNRIPACYCSEKIQPFALRRNQTSRFIYPIHR
jgi:hypothetical protein